MKQSTSMTPSSSYIDALREGQIREAYINSLPPRSRPFHGTSVDLFLEERDLSIKGEIVEDGQGSEGSALTLGATLGIEYWRDELLIRRGRPVIEATELTALWAGPTYEQLLQGPREVRLYTNSQSEAQQPCTAGLLVGIEIIALRDSSQKVLFLASQEGSPGDVEILTPSDEYEVALARVLAGGCLTIHK
jgi:hypothetical protein